MAHNDAAVVKQEFWTEVQNMPRSRFKDGLGKRSEEVLLELRGRLDNGVYPIGTLLPPENALCGELGVGLSTLRRAKTRLVAEGRVKVRRGAGTSVLPKLEPYRESRSLAIMFPLRQQYFQQFQEYALAKQVLLVPFDRSEKGWSPAPERTFLECVRQARYRGVLACCTPEKPQNDALLFAMEAEGMRIIHLEPYTTDCIQGSFLFPDYRRAGYAAVTKLLLAGYTRLRYLKTEYDWPAATLAREGFVAGVQDHMGAALTEFAFYDMPVNLDTLPEEKKRVLAELARLEAGTGILCHDYLVAIRLLECLREAGQAVPEKVGVLCIEYFDDNLTGPPLDMITFDRADALQRSLEWVFSPESQPLRELLPPRSVPRGSLRTL